MTLARRLLAGALVVVVALVAAILLIAGGRLRTRLLAETVDHLARDARIVGAVWETGMNGDSLARVAGDALGYRVTLIDPSGVVVGDAEFVGDARRRLESQATLPEVAGARARGVGSARRRDAAASVEQLYVAVRHPRGVVRVAQSTVSLDDMVRGAQRDVLVSGLVALLGVLALTWLFARSITQPVVELRDVARAIAAGDLHRRPALSAPGEVGDLATALHRMAEQLRARLDALVADDLLMVAVLESLEEGVLALDERGTVVRINERARQLLNVQAPVPFRPELLPRDPLLRRAMDESLAGASTAPAEASLFDRTLAIAARPLSTAGAVVTVLDLTMLRRLETIRRDFVANVSHELKTPLTVVSGYAETLLDEGIPAEHRRQFIATIRDNAQRMQRIVDDLLDLSRIESGVWRPNYVTVSIPSVVAEVMAALRQEAEAKGLTLGVEIPGDAANVQADPTAFRQIVANLVENAVRYTREGSVSLRTYRDGEGTRLEVHDTGVGIAAEHLPRIFERFYRADAGRSRGQGGTGLGLAIVRHLVDAHGGRVEASSTVGRGTTISVLFPGVTPSS